MKLYSSDAVVNRRLMIAVALASLAIIMVAAQIFRPVASPGASVQREDSKATVVAVSRVLDSLFVRYGIEKAAVSTWQVHSAGGKFSRVEQRVPVSPEFLSLQFNHDLAASVAPLGFRVSATERAKENIVTMHIIQDDVTIRSITFLVK